MSLRLVNFEMENMRMHTMMKHVLFSKHMRMTHDKIKILIIYFDFRIIIRKKIIKTINFFS